MSSSTASGKRVIQVTSKSKSCRGKFNKRNSPDNAALTLFIPEMNKVLNRNSSPFRRIFWSLAVLACGAVCVYQFQISLTYYLSYPTTTDVSYDRAQTVDFPAITICASKSPELSHTSDFLKTISPAKMPFRCPKAFAQQYEKLNITFESQNTTLSDVWNMNSIPADAVKVTIPCLASPDENDTCVEEMASYNMTKEYMQTFIGKCVILTPTLPVQYQGPNTYLNFKVETTGNARTYNGFITNIQIFIHTPGLKLLHDAVFLADYMYRQYKTNLRFSLSRFQFLNKTDKRCYNSKITNNICRNRCIEEQLDSRMSCKLPFMNEGSKLRECENIGDSVKAYNEAHLYYVGMKTHECQCFRSCNDTVYHVSIDVEGETKSNDTEFMLYFSDNLVDSMQESYAYSFTALISDIGGSLGFFLGVCCLSCIEILEKICEKMFNALRSTR